MIDETISDEALSELAEALEDACQADWQDERAYDLGRMFREVYP